MLGKLEMAQEHLRQAAAILDVVKEFREAIEPQVPSALPDQNKVIKAPVDGIQFQKFQQEGNLDWTYFITSVRGREYMLTYSVVPNGFVSEKLFIRQDEGNILVLERDIKVGWNYRPTVEEVINNGGVIPRSVW